MGFELYSNSIRTWFELKFLLNLNFYSRNIKLISQFKLKFKLKLNFYSRNRRNIKLITKIRTRIEFESNSNRLKLHFFPILEQCVQCGCVSLLSMWTRALLHLHQFYLWKKILAKLVKTNDHYLEDHQKVNISWKRG